MAFDQTKTAQMAAYIIAHCDGGSMDVMKLMKLLYLSDREAFDRYGTAITGDRMVSMPYGPVLSRTLNTINGEGPRVEGGWDAWIAGRAGHKVSLARHRPTPDRDELDELSDAELAVIDSVCARFGRMNSYELSDFTHSNCEEWVDPNGSSYPILYQTLFQALGKPLATAELLAMQAQDDDRIDQIFSRL